jgi:ABC-type sugar transport system substrate-binding protein
MQFAAFTKRTFLTVSFPAVFSLPITAQASRSTAAVSAKPETVEWVYRIRYGFEDECSKSSD